MRRLLSLLLLTLWLLMNGNSSYAFMKTNCSNVSSNSVEKLGVDDFKSLQLSPSVNNEEEKVFYVEEDEEEEEDLLHTNLRLHAVILYHLLFEFKGADSQLSCFSSKFDITPACTPVYLVCQNIRI